MILICNKEIVLFIQKLHFFKVLGKKKGNSNAQIHDIWAKSI